MLIAYVIIIGYETKNWYASPHTILHVSIPIVLLSAALSLSEYIYMKYFHWDMMIHNYTNTSGYLDPLYRNQLMEEASRAEEIARHNAFSGFTILLAVGVLSVFVALVIYRNKTK